MGKLIRINHTLEKLTLDDCLLGNSGCQEVIDAFYVNTKIKSLSIQSKEKKKKLKQSENGFDHKTTRFLSEMLKMNENLEHINISSKLFW